MKTYILQAAVGIAGTWEAWMPILTPSQAVHAASLVPAAFLAQEENSGNLRTAIGCVPLVDPGPIDEVVGILELAGRIRGWGGFPIRTSIRFTILEVCDGI